MTVRRRVLGVVNAGARRAKLEVHDRQGAPWDAQFEGWIRDAKRRGIDPNDVGDTDWGVEQLELGLRKFYEPNIPSGSVILELGPGTGRLTRHLVARSKKLIVADYSTVVCKWMSEYLDGKVDHEVLLLENQSLAPVPDSSVDALVAHGVVEHLDFDELFWFLTEFRRVLRDAAVCIFNFNNVMTDEGLGLIRRTTRPFERCLFRLYHPEIVRRLATEAGFTEAEVHEQAGRFAFAVLRA